MTSLPIPDVAHYETDFVKLADGNNHEVLLEFVKEQESKKFGKWEMLFRVHKHRVNGGAMIEYEPPKSFNTSAKEFAMWTVEAASNGQPAFWANIFYHEKSKDWVIKPSTQSPRVVEERLVKGAMR